MKIIPDSRKHRYVAGVAVFLIAAALIAGMVGCDGYTPSQDLEIRDWYDLDAVRDNLGGNHILMNDLDSDTTGYEELAGPTANGGKGWQPIGDWHTEFNGTFDGQGYKIRDLFIYRPEKDDVGLFGVVDEEGRIKDIGVVNVNVTGWAFVGGLVGDNLGHVNNSYSTGSVTGTEVVGGLLGSSLGPVSDSYSIGHVIGDQVVGGLVGGNGGPVSDSYSTGSVTGRQVVGGLVGANSRNTVSNSYFTGSVTGDEIVGGLMGENEGTVTDSYSTGSVNGDWAVGGLMGTNVDTVSNSRSSSRVTGEKYVGGLLGLIEGGTVTDSYCTGNVTGDEYIGGLVGGSKGTVSSSYSTGSVTGISYVGGLVGDNWCTELSCGIVINSFWDTETSGQATSDGGTGKNTTEMQDIATFSDAAWDIVAVANPGTRNPSYIWNIVNGVAHPFLSWEP